MEDVLDDIRSQVGAENLVTACSRDDCEVCMTDVPQERIIVDADLAFPAHAMGGERCDFIVFLLDHDGNLRALPLELKSGSVAVQKAVRQLRRGALFVDRFGPDDPSPVCRPILIHGRPLTFHDRKRLNRLKVRYRGLELTIKTARCGTERNLAQALA